MAYTKWFNCVICLIATIVTLGDTTIAPTIKLNNGLDIPVIGLGTWKSRGGDVVQAVKDAIDAGYRHIDTAWIYQNEKEVGEGIKAKIDEGVVKREDLFIVTKLYNTFHKPEDVEPAINQSLSALGLDYLDLYLMHTPMDFQKIVNTNLPVDKTGQAIPAGVDFVDTWNAMEKVYRKGLTKSIGVSNFNKRQIEKILEKGSVVPVTNQVECHPYLNQKKLAEFCKSKGITITAYSPLGSADRPWAKPDDPKLLDDPNLKRIADKYKKSAAQIVLRYLIQSGYIAIPKSVNKGRIQENINIFDFELTPEDMKYVDSFDRNGRIFKFDWGSKHQYYPFNDEY